MSVYDWLIMQAFIISWEGQTDNAREIATALAGEVEHIHVIYSSHANTIEEGDGNWVKVPDSWFFGKKFSHGLDLFNGEILLLIQADAQCDDWPQLVRRCRAAFALNKVGVWGPAVDYNAHDYDFSQRIRDRRTLYQAVNIDAVVTAYSRCVVDRLREFSYEHNNLGWGIDWASNCYSRVNNLCVLRDRAIDVVHPRERGYDATEAESQMVLFLDQMTEQEKVQYALLSTYRSVCIAQEHSMQSSQ
ncbi:hypothetical protein BOW53_15730 [Solemya pervernicosa gill symbiont]|uniref:Glycosyltransferase 2-like domain-containing protein n=1 Tax=Solemya pervernicosa gill symbiont TaxID=642797 RepID=A0A1T2KZW0_9GAMM|nr:hypothetical protein [Solemya pervernicosa gill symbiont]OOZ38397.1 hypothetical protein BOW53_15730 [Solemya pervernicosa gill symbiont]